MTTYSVPGATSTEFRDINDAGSIIGQYSSASSTHGFVIAHDTFTSFDYPGATDTFPLGINDRGDIAGQAQVNNVSVGFIRHADGQFETFAPSPYIRRMNNPEHLVGLDLLTGASFLFRNGTLTLFNVPGAPSTSAVGMNDPDEIVGVYSVGGAEHSFLKSGSSYCEVKVPNSSETLANDINNAGEIVGVFSGVTAEGGGFHGFVARPAHP